MTLLILSFALLQSFASTEQTIANPIKKDSTDLFKIATKAGLSTWENTTSIAFHFNVVREGKILRSRAWQWNRNTGDVTMTAGVETTSYNLNKPLDSLAQQADQSFVNDSYWLLVPIKLLTDTGTTVIYFKEKEAPISKTTLNMLTIIYGDTGGYTPGDAYDVYYDANFDIKEWAYRKANSETAQLVTTFENYKNMNGLNIATDHVMSDGKTSINFSDIIVNTN